MKIKSVKIENFRAFKNETIEFDNYNCIVGSNGAGKSTILNALNVFFRSFKDSTTDLSKLSENDFHHKNTADEIRITVTFDDLTDEAKAALSTYVRHGLLIVSAVARFDSSTGRAEIKQYGNRLVMRIFKVWFEKNKDGAKVSELQSTYNDFLSEYPDLPQVRTKADMEAALNTYEETHLEKCELIPSEDQFYGATKGINKLAPYIQWVFVSASKDVTSEATESKTSALGQLLERAVRSKVNFSVKVNDLRENLKLEYQRMLDAEQSALSDISTSIERRLKVWANPSVTAKVEWKQDPDKSIKVEEPYAHILVGEKGFDGELGRFGHGMQRSFLLSILQELASIGISGPTLIMGIEEPELYQHPPQAKYLSEVIQTLSEGGCQVIACSHSPYFIPADNFSSVRVVRETSDPCHSEVSSVGYEEISKKLQEVGETLVPTKGLLAKLYPTLRPEINEMFFCKKLLLVEGIEDIAHIITYIELMSRSDQFRSEGWHIVPVSGKSNLMYPICIAQALKIPVYVICDADTDKEDLIYMAELAKSTEQTKINKLKKITDEITQHKKENKAILQLLNADTSLHWPNETIEIANLTMWKSNITEIIKNEFGENWTMYKTKAAASFGNIANLQKNPLAVAKTLELAWNDEIKSDALTSLVNNIFKLNQDGNS